MRKNPLKKQIKGEHMFNAEQVVKELGLGISQGQMLKIQKLLNEIYSKATPSDDKVKEIILNIYLADKSLSAIDDIYFISYGKNHMAIEFKYSFLPKKLTELGVFKVVDAYVVREGEFFEVEINNGETKIHHKQNPFATSNKIIGAYARGVKEDGSVVIATANLNELQMAAKASKIKSKGKSNVWDVWFEEMAKKLPLKRLVKLISIPPEIQNALDIDNANYASSEEIVNQDKANDAIEAMNELNAINKKDKNTIKDYLDKNEVEYDFKQGYIKVAEDIINLMQHKDELLKYLKPLKKAPGYLVGKADTEINIPDSNQEEIEYVSE